MRRLRQRRQSAMSLRMAPMIDVIFLLLTFFVLTARFRVPEQFLPINLPSAAYARQIGVIEPLVINLVADDSQCIANFGAAGQAGESVIRAETIDADLAVFVGDFVEVLRSQKRHVGDPVAERVGALLLVGDQRGVDRRRHLDRAQPGQPAAPRG